MLVEKIEELVKKILLVARDAEKFDNGNASAGTRVRKDLMNLTKEIKEARQHVLDERKNRTVEDRETL